MQLTVASPWLLMALQEYTPPSKFPGLRISREQIPWTQICLNLGSSPIIIWFFIHWTLGCGEREKNDNLIFEWRNGLGKAEEVFLFGFGTTWQEEGKKKKLWLKWTHSRPPPPHCGNFNSADRVRTSWGGPFWMSCLRPCFHADLWPSRPPLQLRRFKEHNTASNLFIKSYWKTGGIMRPNGRWESRLPGQMKIQHTKLSQAAGMHNQTSVVQINQAVSEECSISCASHSYCSTTANAPGSGRGFAAHGCCVILNHLPKRWIKRSQTASSHFIPICFHYKLKISERRLAAARERPDRSHAHCLLYSPVQKLCLRCVHRLPTLRFANQRTGFVFDLREYRVVKYAWLKMFSVTSGAYPIVLFFNRTI